jgi:hypothetical protein
VAEHLAIASPFGPLEQCLPQHFCRQTQNVVQSTHVDFAQVRRETVERIDISANRFGLSRNRSIRRDKDGNTSFRFAERGPATHPL